MEHHEEPARADTGASIDRAFTAIADGLAADDPRFVRRVVRRASGGLANLVVLAAVLATLVLGVVPLAVGLATDLAGLLVAGALGCVLLPVAVPAVARLG